MAAGDKPYMVSAGRVTWEIQASEGVAPAGAAWKPFGYRVGDLTDPGPLNTWSNHRTWNSGREGAKLDRLTKDYGGPLGEFKLTDLRVPGFAWGEEVSAPTIIGGGPYYRHKATATTNHPGAMKAVQVHDADADGNVETVTFLDGVMTELELSGNEAGEVHFAPTYIFRKEDTGVTLKTVTDPTSTSYKHHHGYIEVFGSQLLRVLSWRFRKVSKANRARYWNDTDPLLANEYPLEDADYLFSVRAVADGKQFSGFSNRTIRRIAENGDIGKGVVRWAKTVDQDEGKIVIGDSNDALALARAPRIRPAAGGKVVYDLEFACRTAYYEWVDQSAASYFPS